MRVSNRRDPAVVREKRAGHTAHRRKLLGKYQACEWISLTGLGGVQLSSRVTRNQDVNTTRVGSFFVGR